MESNKRNWIYYKLWWIQASRVPDKTNQNIDVYDIIWSEVSVSYGITSFEFPFG